MSVHWGIKAATVVLLSGALNACVPYPREREAYSDLCQSEYQFTVPGMAGKNKIFLQTWLFDHETTHERYKQAHFTIPYVQGPGAPHEFYVQLIAWNEDRKRPSRASSRGEPAIPILYDSRQAYITFENGSRLFARPEIFIGNNKVYDFPTPDMAYARPSPYDINSDEVHRLVPKLTNNDDYGSVYVLFKTAAFNANSKWTINLGSLEVNGQKIAIPPLRLCYHPLKKWVGIEPLMRP